MSGKVYVAGHSLGAADAALYACSRLKRGLAVDGVYLFACPRPGNLVVSTLLNRVPVVSIKNRLDLVTDVPLDAHVAEMNWDYANAAPFTVIDEPASWSDFVADPFFAHHHIDLYIRGTLKLPGDLIHVVVGQVARLYGTAEGWDWINPVDGLYWAMAKAGDDRLLIRRGSATGKDWLTEDADFSQIDLFGAKVSKGFWAGVQPVEATLDGVLS